MGISRSTLNKHFTDNLVSREVARDRVEADRLAALYAAAMAGKIGAIRELGRELGTVAGPVRQPRQGKKEQRQDAANVVASSGCYAVPGPPRIGKKQVAEEAAKTAGLGTDWGDDLIAMGLIEGDPDD